MKIEDMELRAQDNSMENRHVYSGFCAFPNLQARKLIAVAKAAKEHISNRFDIDDNISLRLALDQRLREALEDLERD